MASTIESNMPFGAISMLSTSRLSLTTCLLVAVFSPFEQPQHESQPEIKINREGRVSIPVRVSVQNNMVTLRVTVASRAAVFLVDTGATNTCLDERFANRLGLTVDTAKNAIAANGAVVQAGRATVRDFRVGLVCVSRLPVEVIDLSKINAFHRANGEVEYDGIIGGNFLKAFDGIVDYKERMLFLHDKQAVERKALQGAWVCKSIEYRDEKVDQQDETKHYTVIVTGTNFEFKANLADGWTRSGVFVPDPTHAPKRFLLADHGSAKELVGIHLNGLYELNDGTLRMMVADGWVASIERFPKQLVPTPKFAVFTFRRMTGYRVVCNVVAYLSDGLLLGKSAHYLTIMGGVSILFPIDGVYRAQGWDYQLYKNGNVTAQNRERTIRVTFRPDGTYEVESITGLTLPRSGGKK